MKILIMVVSCFLSISILNAEDVKKNVEESSSTEKNDEAKIELGKPELAMLGIDENIEVVKSSGAFAGKPISISSNTLKGELQIEKKKKPEISTLGELKKIQNMQIVELKKSQNKDLESFGESAKNRIKMKSEYRKALMDLKMKHREEQTEFKKAHPLKKDSKKGKEVGK